VTDDTAGGPTTPRSPTHYQIRVDLNPNGIIAPVQQTAFLTSNIVAAAIAAFADDARLVSEETGVAYRWTAQKMTADQRREAYHNWLFAKAFQDLVQGLRRSLEEASLFLALANKTTITAKADGDAMAVFNDYTADLRRKAGRQHFPELLAQVNAGLTSPLRFYDEALSLRRARNCFEYRAGIVGQEDVAEGSDGLTLTFPTIAMSYMRDGNRIVVASGEIIDTRNEPIELSLQVQPSTIKNYGLGERISFTVSDFSAMAFGCVLFASDLAARLPNLPRREGGTVRNSA